MDTDNEKESHRHFHIFESISGENLNWTIGIIGVVFIIFSFIKAVQTNFTEINNVELNKVQRMDPESLCSSKLDKCEKDLKPFMRGKAE